LSLIRKALTEATCQKPVDTELHMHHYLVHGGAMVWQVRLSKKMEKKSKTLPLVVQGLLFQLMREIAILGPVRGDWPNYSKLGAGQHHCHLKKGSLVMLQFGKKEINKSV
jgi:hypothetical protein